MRPLSKGDENRMAASGRPNRSRKNQQAKIELLKKARIRRKREANQYPDKVKYRRYRNLVQVYLNNVDQVRNEELDIGNYDVDEDLKHFMQEFRKRIDGL